MFPYNAQHCVCMQVDVYTHAFMYICVRVHQSKEVRFIKSMSRNMAKPCCENIHKTPCTRTYMKCIKMYMYHVPNRVFFLCLLEVNLLVAHVSMTSIFDPTMA